MELSFLWGIIGSVLLECWFQDTLIFDVSDLQGNLEWLQNYHPLSHWSQSSSESRTVHASFSSTCVWASVHLIGARNSEVMEVEPLCRLLRKLLITTQGAECQMWLSGSAGGAGIQGGDGVQEMLAQFLQDPCKAQDDQENG